MRLVRPSLDVPYSVHLLATSRCNLNCEGCYYRGEGEWSLSAVRSLVDEMAGLGVEWLAIGGGEPFLWEPLPYILGYARGRGVKTTVTTNGTILLDVAPDRLHVSHDRMHQTSEEQVQKALAHYSALGAEVGLNVIADDISFLEGLDWCQAVTLLLPKPMRPFPFRHWADVWQWARTRAAWLDACLAVLLKEYGFLRASFPCKQGRSSLSLKANGTVNICSNVPASVGFTGLLEAWDKVRLRTWQFDCPMVKEAM